MSCCVIEVPASAVTFSVSVKLHVNQSANFLLSVWGSWHHHQPCSMKNCDLLSTLTLAAWDISHAGLVCTVALTLPSNRARKLSKLFPIATRHRNEVFTVTYCAFNLLLRCLRFACRTCLSSLRLSHRLSSLRLSHPSVFASPVALSSLLDGCHNYCQQFVTLVQSSQLGASK